jgi:hypothetical protein
MKTETIPTVTMVLGRIVHLGKLPNPTLRAIFSSAQRIKNRKDNSLVGTSYDWDDGEHDSESWGQHSDSYGDYSDSGH